MLDLRTYLKIKHILNKYNNAKLRITIERDDEGKDLEIWSRITSNDFSNADIIRNQLLSSSIRDIHDLLNYEFTEENLDIKFFKGEEETTFLNLLKFFINDIGFSLPSLGVILDSIYLTINFEVRGDRVLIVRDYNFFVYDHLEGIEEIKPKKL